MIAGLLPFEGDIIIDTISQKTSSVLYRQHVSWGEAEPVYPLFITGVDLISLYQKIRKAPQKDVDRILSLLKMADYVADSIGTYSAGMKKKLSLLLAFIGNPPLCVLDEPLITLDAESLFLVCDFIREKHKVQGTTFLMSSHQELHASQVLFGKELIVENQSITLNDPGR